MKGRKSEGSDGIVVKMIEAAGGIATEKVLTLANKIYITGEITKEAEFIVIREKEGVTDCDKHRKISIMSQVAKIVSKVIGLRLKNKIEQYVDQEYFGFNRSG